MKELKRLYGESLNYDNINFSDYFRTLSGEAHRQGFLTDKQFNSLKKGIGEILSKTVAEYTNYESTSIMKDTANDIFLSILYCLDVALFSFSSHEESVAYIEDTPIDEIYVMGQKVIRRCVFESVSLLVKNRNDRINFADKSYDSMLDGEIKAHLKRYNSKYFAHGTNRVLKYPSVNGCGGLRGILYTKKYLENILYETSFVKKYDEEKVQNICYGYCETNDRAYNDLGTNIFSLVFMNSIFAEMAGNSGDLTVSKADANELSKLLKRLPENNQRDIICDAAKKVCEDIYCEKAAKRLAGHVVNAVNKNELNRVIYVGDI